MMTMRIPMFAVVLIICGCETPPKTTPSRSSTAATPAPTPGRQTTRPARQARASGSPLIRGHTVASSPELSSSIPKTPVGTPSTQLPWNGPPELAMHAGKVVFIDFFGAWCGSCEISSRYMQVIHERFINDPEVEIIAAHVGSNYDRWESAADYLAEMGVSYPAIEDGNSIAAQYDVDSLPAFVLLDREGNTAYEQQGMFASNINSFISLIEHEKTK